MNAGRWLAHVRSVKIAPRNGNLFGRVPRRVPRPVAVGVLLTMALVAAVPSGVVQDGPGAGFPLRLPSWLQPDPDHDWGREAFNGIPQQQKAGKPGALTQDQLDELGRVGRGAGNPAGKGIGAVGPYQAPKHRVDIGKSAVRSGPASFDEQTSTLVPAKGSADSELYQNADGSFTRREYSGQVNVKAADGTWQRIDTDLIDDGKRLHPKVSAADVSIAKSADDPQLVILRNVGGGTFGYSLQGAAKVPGEVTGDTVTYKGVQPGIDLQLRATGDGVKEDLVVADAKAGNAWVFPLNLEHLTARNGADGAIELVGTDGKVAAVIPSGIVHDSKYDPQSGGFEQATEAKYEIVDLNGRQALQVSVDRAWLDDAARVWPVVVDPSVTTALDATQDTTVRNDRSSDQSGDVEMSIGNNGSGVKAYSFLKFSNFFSTFANVNVTAAKLNVFDRWAYTCTPKSFEVNPISVGWNTGALSYPGPAFGSSIGSVTPNVPTACGNGGGNPAIGDWVVVNLSVGTFNNWARNIGNNGLAITTSQTDPFHWKKFTTANYNPNYAPFLQITYQFETPVVTSTLPPYGYAAPTLTPELQVLAYDPDHAPNANLSYNFVVQDKNGVTKWTSGAQASPTVRVPAGSLKWGETYTWIALASDGSSAQVYQDWQTFTTSVPQPDITSTLSQNGELGYEPSVRNYTTTATDATVATVGPALTVERDYNSLDPRTNSAFGQGWSSVFDLSVTEVMSGDATPVVDTVTVRYPTGQEIAFGRNTDGSFASPPGRFATFTKESDGLGYKFVDKDGTAYLFRQALVTGSATTPYTWGITSITDASDRKETFSYTNNLISQVTSASGRSLHLTWAAPGGTPGYAEATSPATFSDQTDDPGVTVLPLTGDDVSTGVTLPFAFPLYGQNYTNATVSSNGVIAFAGFAADGDNSAIPSAANPNGALYPFWDDLQINGQATVTTKTSGTAPNRVFSIEWYEAYLFGRSTRVTVKAALSENGTITFSYDGIDPANDQDKGAAAVVGIENATGTAAVQHSFHQPVLASNTQITYTPMATPPPGVTAKVASVATDPVGDDQGTALTWTYTYDANGQLQKVCPPTSTTACHTYTYGTASLYQSAVQNLGPRAYWRLGEAAGEPAAVSEVIENQGTDNGTYAGVAATSAGPLPASTVTAPTFNGTSSMVTVPSKDLPFGSGYQSVSMWFKVAPDDRGILLGFSKDQAGTGGTSGTYTPALYVGTSGKLYGELWNGTVNPIASTNTVDNGAWHHVVLTGAGATQSLYLDGELQGSRSGVLNMAYADLLKNVAIGSGYWGHAWPDQPAAGVTEQTGWFDGSIAEVSSFDRPLTPANIASIYKAGTATARPLTAVKRPSGNTTAAIVYEAKDSTVKTVTDSNGGVWQLGPPVTTGSSKVYASAALAGSPADYYRFGDGDGAAFATNEVNGNPATYSNVTLGLPNGLFDDSTAAQFDGSTSIVNLPDTGPGSDIPTNGTYSISLWFKTQTAGGVLFGTWDNTITTSNWHTPRLYIGTDGKLRGGFWTTANGLVMTSAGTVTDGNWHHAAVTASKNSQKLYLDGAEIGSGTNTLADDLSTHATVGAGAWFGWPGASSAQASYFNGFISDVAYYRKQLSAGTVANQYAGWQKSKNTGAPVKIVTVKHPLNNDPQSKDLTYTFDLNTGRKVAESDALGNETRYGYSENGFLRTTTDPLGNITTNEHDVRGNIVSTTTCQVQKDNVCSNVYFEYFPEGGATNATPTPDRRNDMLIRQRDGRSTSATDPNYVTEYTYDTNGNRTSTKDPLGRITKTDLTSSTQAYGSPAGVFAPNGLQRAVTIPSGGVQTVDYFANGDVAQLTDPAGKVVKFTYDNLGRIASQLEYTETTPTGGGSTFTYDGQNRVSTQTGTPVTNRITGAVHTTVTTTSYDVDGHVLSQVVSDPTGGDASRTMSSSFNTYGQTVTETNGGKTTTYEYDVLGDVVKETGADGGITQNEYDAEHRLRFVKVLNYTGDPNAPSAPTTLTLNEKQYDGNGRMVLEIDAMGFQTVHQYTDNGLEAKIIRKNPTAGQPDFIQVDNSFDAAGNIVKAVTDNGTATKLYTLDKANRVTGETFDPTGINRTTTMSLSPDDRAIASVVTDGTGTVLSRSENTYDELGRDTSSTTYNTAGLTPVARWKLDETTGVTAADSVGNSAATATNVAWSTDHPATSTSAGSAVFNGTNAYASTAGQVLDTTNGFTVSAWAKRAAGTGWQTVVTQEGVNQTAFALQVEPITGKWSWQLRSSDVASPVQYQVLSASAAATNTWTHLVGVYDADSQTMSLYVNNAAPTTTAVRLPWKAKGPLTVGRNFSGGYGDYWNGSISDVQAYSRPLTAAEIGQVYGGTAPAAGATVTRSTAKLSKAGQILASTDALGNVTDNTYDEAGRLAVITGPAAMAESDGGTPLSTRPVTYMGYDTFGLRTHVKDPRGGVTRTTYDSAGHVLTSIAPAYTAPGSSTALTPTTTRVYDDTGQLIKLTDALNHDTLYTYDQLGRVSKTVAADTGVTKFGYDANGDQTTVTDATGAATTNTYDFLARKVTTSAVVRQDSTHYDTLFEYGTDGKLKKTTSPTGVTQEQTYNAAGDVVTLKDGAGNVTATTYDAVGRSTKTTLADNSYTTVTYDLAGHPVKSEQFAAGGGAALTTTSQTYDRGGQIRTKTDARGTTITFGYDAVGRLTQETQPVDAVPANNIVTTFGYDVAGNQTRFTDGRGNAFITKYNVWNVPEEQIEPSTTAHPNLTDRTFKIAYDALARPVTQTMPGGVTITNTYNEVGKLTGQTGAGAEVTTAARSFGYDLAGHLTSTTGSGGANTFTYDDRGQLRTTSGVSGAATFTYKNDGQLSTRADAAGSTAYNYDTAGRLDTVANTTTSVQTKLTYNTINQPKTVIYGGTGNVRTFGYDTRHRLNTDELKTSGGTAVASITYGYDNNGNETSKATTGFGGTVSNTYTYDLADRLLSWNNGTATTAYTYDKASNRLTNGTKTFTYDQRNRLLTQSGGTTYTYTPRGTLASANGVLTKTDAYGQVTQQGTTTYTYDGLGRQTKTGLSYTGVDNDLAADTTATYTRDPGGSVVGVKGASAQYAFTDQHDDLTGLFTATGTATSGTTVYDPLGKVLATTGMQGSLGYQSEWTDQSTSRVNMMARWYNTDTGQFDTRDTASNSPIPNSAAANRFAYGDANPLIATDPSGHWSLKSALKSVASAVSTVAKAVLPPVVYNFAATVVSAAYSVASTVYKYTVAPLVKAATTVYTAGRKYAAQAGHALTRMGQAASAAYKQGGLLAVAKTAKAASAKRLADAVVNTAKFIKDHKNQIIEGLAIVGGVLAGMACTAATAGAGAVACMVGAAALVNLAKDAAQGNIHSWKDALTSAGTGAMQGIAGPLGGVVGGKVACFAATKLAGMAVNAVGKVVAGAISGAIAGAVSGAVEDIVSQIGTNGRVDWGSVATSAAIGGITGAISGGRAGRASPCGRHSFDPQTAVLMADGSTKKIEDIELGDEVTATDPETGTTSAKPVTKLWVNHDTDLTDVTIRVKTATTKGANASKPSKLATAGAALVTAAAVAVGTTTTVLHTTQHHPFWDRTTSTWVNAADLKPGTELKTDEGATAEVVAVDNFTGAKDMRDLTVADVHTYHVSTAGATILVHNRTVCGAPGGDDEVIEWDNANTHDPARFPNRDAHDTSTQTPIDDDAVRTSGAGGLQDGEHTYVVQSGGGVRSFHNETVQGREVGWDFVGGTHPGAGHTSLAGRSGGQANPVIAAGNFHVRNGEIVQVGNESGHYQPQRYGPGNDALFHIALRAFANARFPISRNVEWNDW